MQAPATVAHAATIEPMLLTVHGLPEYLDTAEVWLLHGSVLGVTMAAILAVLGLFWPTRFAPMPTQVVAALSATALGAYFVMRFLESGAEPLRNAFEVLLLISLGVVVAYFASLPRLRRPALAGWVFPGAALTMFTSLLVADAAGPAAAKAGVESRLSDPLLLTHILTVILSCALFAFATAVSMVYLLQDRTLRRKRHNRVLQSLPPIEALRGMVVSCTRIGLPLMTVSLVTGFLSIWDQIGEWLAKPLVIMSILMWLVFVLAAVGQRRGWLNGRRFVILILAGFVLILVTFFGTGFIPGKHSFVRELRPTSAETGTNQQGHR